MRGGNIRWVEWREQLRVMIWLCGLMRYCQYESQSVFSNFAIASLWVSALTFHLLCNSFKLGSSFGLPPFTKLVANKVWFTAFTIFFDTPATLNIASSACLILASHSVKRMSLCVSSISGRLAFLPSSVSFHSMNSEILVLRSINSVIWSIALSVS